MWIFVWLINGLILAIFNAISLFVGLAYLLPDVWRFLFRDKETKALLKKLKSTQNYEEWLALAFEIDKKSNRLEWKYLRKSSLYDYEYMENMLKHLVELMGKKNPIELARFIRSLVSRDFSNLTNEKLYRYLYSGTKQLIDDYYATLLKALDYLASCKFQGKKTFFKEIKDFYGKTSLMLSGGASVGMFHLGLLSNLVEQDILPTIISGASAGSLTCALIGTKTDEELKELARSDFTALNFEGLSKKINKGSLIRKLIRLVRYGYFIDKKPLMQFLKDNTDSLTFAEAYKKTGRIINISIGDSAHNKYRLLNYITAPDVYVWSAAIASCSLPFVYAPSKVICKTCDGSAKQWLPGNKKFVDGSIGADIPKKALGMLFNASCFIVSQANIFIVPFITRGTHRRHSKGYVFLKLWNMISGIFISELRHRIDQLNAIGYLPNRLVLLSNILTQDYTGNVNIVPELQLKDIIEILSNPSPKSVKEWCARSRNTTFCYIKQIKDFKQVEDKLAKIYESLMKETDISTAVVSPDGAESLNKSINWG